MAKTNSEKTKANPENTNSEYSRDNEAYRGKRKRSTAYIVSVVVIIVVAVLLVVSIGGFSIFRWLYGNDKTDIQGTWYVAGSDVPVVITENTIQLNDNVSYGYTIDAESKTITFNFNTLEGSGRYRFSVDRQQLAIMDGDYTWVNTLLSDIAWTADALVTSIQGKEKSPADEENVTLLSRASATLGLQDEAESASEEAETPEEPDGAETPDGADTQGGAQGEPGTSEAPAGTEAPDNSGAPDGADTQDGAQGGAQGEPDTSGESGEAGEPSESAPSEAPNTSNMFGLYDR